MKQVLAPVDQCGVPRVVSALLGRMAIDGRIYQSSRRATEAVLGPGRPRGQARRSDVFSWRTTSGQWHSVRLGQACRCHPLGEAGFDHDLPQVVNRLVHSGHRSIGGVARLEDRKIGQGTCDAVSFTQVNRRPMEDLFADLDFESGEPSPPRSVSRSMRSPRSVLHPHRHSTTPGSAHLGHWRQTDA